MTGFADWAEQLIAESTGKNGTGVLPVVVQGDPNNPDPEVRSPAPDMTVARLVADSTGEGLGDDVADNAEVAAPTASDPLRSEVQVSGSLGAQLLLWEVATVAAGRILGINPFDQPDVESAKKAARGLLEATDAKPDPPVFTDGAIEVRTLGGDWLRDTGTIAGALDSLLAQLDPQRGYVAIMAFLDRLADAPLADARRAIADSTQRPTTFGWGPRFLHSTGQYHKGGPPTGVFLQITAAPSRGPGHTGPGVHLRGLHQGSGRRRRTDPGRPWTPRPAAAPERPRLRPRPADPGAWPRRVRHEPSQGRPGTEPAARPTDKRLPRIAGPCGLVLSAHRRPGVQEDHAGHLRSGQPRPVAASFSRSGSPAVTGPTRTSPRRPRNRHRPCPHTLPRGGVAKLGRGFRFVPGTFDDPAAFDLLRKTVHKLDQERGTAGNHAFYLRSRRVLLHRVPAAGRSGLSHNTEGAWRPSSSRSRSVTISTAPVS